MPAAQNFQPAVSQTVTNPWAGTHASQFAPPNWATASLPAAATDAAATNTSSYNPFATTAPSYTEPTMLNGSQRTFPQPLHGAASQPNQQQHQQQQLAFAHGRSHSIDTGEMAGVHWQQSHHLRKPTGAQNGAVSSTPSVASSSNPWPTSTPSVPSASSQGPGVDPFDVAWAAKSVNKSNSNPFGSKSVKQFEVQL
jgi:hypothetical protein